MTLLINGPAAMLGSRGIRRYYASVMKHLRWPGDTEVIPHGEWRFMERVIEFMRPGRSDAIFWTPCQRGPLFAKHHVVTVHDCISVEYVYPGDWRLRPYLRLFLQVLQNAESVVAISHATKASILRNYPIDERKITVIPSGCDFPIEPSPPLDAHPPVARTVDPFVLMVTNDLPHKNTTRACEALALSSLPRRGVALEVVGTLTKEAELTCRNAGIPLKIHSQISDAQLRGLYEACLFLYSPSLDEGHNLPIAEALACGANVLCSDIAVHREYYQGRVSVFDPCRVDSMSSALEAAVNRPGHWPIDLKASPLRSFAEVARDYEAVFLAVQDRR